MCMNEWSTVNSWGFQHFIIKCKMWKGGLIQSFFPRRISDSHTEPLEYIKIHSKQCFFKQFSLSYTWIDFRNVSLHRPRHIQTYYEALIYYKFSLTCMSQAAVTVFFIGLRHCYQTREPTSQSKQIKYIQHKIDEKLLDSSHIYAHIL